MPNAQIGGVAWHAFALQQHREQVTGDVAIPGKPGCNRSWQSQATPLERLDDGEAHPVERARGQSLHPGQAAVEGPASGAVFVGEEVPQFLKHAGIDRLADSEGQGIHQLMGDALAIELAEVVEDHIDAFLRILGNDLAQALGKNPAVVGVILDLHPLCQQFESRSRCDRLASDQVSHQSRCRGPCLPRVVVQKRVQ